MTHHKRKIKQNIYGNWVGYIGRERYMEFGIDDIAAGHWLLTGEEARDAGYSDKNIEPARKAAAES